MVTTGGPYTGTVSYSFDEACLNPVAVSKNTPQFYSLWGFFFIKWSHDLTSEGNEMAEK